MTTEFEIWLQQIGLGHFVGNFISNGVDFDVAPDLDIEDLKELGLGVGYRRRFLKAAASLNGAANDRAPTAASPASPLAPALTHLSQTPSTPALPDALNTTMLASPEPTPVAERQSQRGAQTTPAQPTALDRAIVSDATVAERRQVAVLFADLTGYTSLSSELDPEELEDLMATFFRVVDGSILANGGTVDKHLGDGVMAVFGAPVSHGDDSVRAVRAASEIHERLQDVSAERGRALSCHIGVASGEVLAGAGTSEYTVIGDAVNLASRLSDMANAHETFLSDEVHSAVVRETLCERRANVTVKGLEEPVTVWKVVGNRDTLLERDLLPFVGREAERMQFEATIAAVPARCSGAAFIFRGEPGIGKTRLATECLAFAVQKSFETHHVLVLDFGAATGADPLRAIFQSLLGVSETAVTNTLTDVAQGLLLDSDFEADDEPFVFDLLDLSLSADTLAFYAAIENTTRNRRKIDLVGRLLEKRAREKPQIILVEDLHWANPVTMNLCASLAARSANCPAVMLMTSRIEGDPFSSEWRSLTGTTPIYTIDLRPLSQDETLQLAAVAGGDQSERLAIEMAKAGGNPLFLEMMIRSAADNQTEALSGNLRSMVQARIDQLEPADRRAIQAASVIGQRFDLDLVQHLIDKPDYHPRGLLERSLVHPMGDHFLFAHALVQEGVYASVTRRNARAMHLRAAEWFDGRDLVLHAEHLSRANDDRAAAAYHQAARSQSQQLRFETALALVEKGLAHSGAPADRYNLNELKGQLTLRTGAYQVAADSYRAAAKDATNDTDRCRAYLGLADSNRERPGEALDEADRSLDLVRGVFDRLRNDTLKVKYYAIRSSVQIAQGDIAGSLESARMGVELAEKLEDPSLLCLALERYGPPNYQLGAMLSAKTICERLVKTAKEAKDKKSEIMGSVQLSICCHYSNLFDEAISILAVPLKEAERFGAGRAACLGHEYVTRTYLARGQTAKASYHANTALELARVGGLKSREALMLVHLAEAFLLDGDLDAAFDCASSAHELNRGPLAGPWALAAMALARIWKPVGGKYLSRARTLLGSRFFTSHNHFRVALAEMEFGLYHEDWSAIDRAANSLEKFTKAEPLPWTDFHIKRGRAITKWGRGEQDGSYEALLADVCKVRQDLGMKIWLPGDD